MTKFILFIKVGSGQYCQKFRAPNLGKLAFLPAASDIKVAQYISSNHLPNFPNLGLFHLKTLDWLEKQLDC